MFVVKICGMRSPDDVAACVAAGADALGFIFAGGPARLEICQAGEIARHAPAGVTRVGVFADQDRDFVSAALESAGLDVLQFCGRESAKFRGSFGLPTIAVIGVPAGAHDALLPPARLLRESRACAILIDSRYGDRPGGTGLRVRSELAARLRASSPLPCILAGGLNPANVAQAIEDVRPAAVDVRSGVERDGRKDPNLVRAFVTAALTAKGALA